VLQEVEIISSFQVVSGWGVKGRYGEDTRCSLKFDCGYLKFLRLYPDVFIVRNASFNKNGTSSPGTVTGKAYKWEFPSAKYICAIFFVKFLQV
jgi:hypothetical protein